MGPAGTDAGCPHLSPQGRECACAYDAYSASAEVAASPRSTIAVTLDLHAQEVGPHLVRCRCGWVHERGAGAREAWNLHLTDELTAALLAVP